MKKTILAVVVTAVFAALVIAHPPTEISLTSNLADKTVKISVAHQVKDAVEHYIYEVELKVNGKKAIRQDAKTQTSGKGQDVIYVIPGLKAGDKIEVYADCNKTGDLKKEFVIAEDPAPEKKAKPAKKVK